MKKRKRIRITPEMIAKLSPEERKEYLLLLEAKNLPKLERRLRASSPQAFNPDDLREALEVGIKRAPAAELEDDRELVDFFDANGGKDEGLHPVTRGIIRLGRFERGDFDGASEAQIQAENARAAAAAKAKPADPVPEVNALDEAPRQPVIQREQEPRNIFDALNRPTRDPVQVGESFGSWRR
jgi:hypothetical protein